MKKKPKKKARVSSERELKNDIGIRPFGDRVLVKPFTEEELRGNGGKSLNIILPESMTKEKSAQGKVVAVGEGKYLDGELVPMRVRIGDTVIFSKYGYDEVEHRGEEYYLLKEESILAVITK